MSHVSLAKHPPYSFWSRDKVSAWFLACSLWSCAQRKKSCVPIEQKICSTLQKCFTKMPNRIRQLLLFYTRNFKRISYSNLAMTLSMLALNPFHSCWQYIELVDYNKICGTCVSCQQIFNVKLSPSYYLGLNVLHCMNWSLICKFVKLFNARFSNIFYVFNHCNRFGIDKWCSTIFEWSFAKPVHWTPPFLDDLVYHILKYGEQDQQGKAAFGSVQWTQPTRPSNKNESVARNPGWPKSVFSVLVFIGLGSIVSNGSTKSMLPKFYN
jgi:hypothetical protein